MSSEYRRDEVYMIKTTRKISALLICRILFFGCFFLAMILANTLWKNEAAWIGYVHETCFIDINQALRDGSENLLDVALLRLPFWIIIILLGRKGIGIIGADIFGAWQGFALGFLLSAFLIRYGAKGIAAFFCTSFPQILFYFTAYFFLYQVIFNLHQKKQSQTYEEGDVSKRSSVARAYFGICILLSLVFVVGIFIESYVNYFFLLKIPAIIS